MDGFFLPMIRSLLWNRRVLLFILFAVFVVIIGRYVFTEQLATRIVVKLGYWVLLCVFGYFCYAVIRVEAKLWQGWPSTKRSLGVIGAIAITSAVLLAHERYGFKILTDEVTLLGTSMEMHYEKNIAYPVRATDVQGPFQILQGRLDHRPFFYPFLVSLAHDITGYRIENAFYINTLLGVLFLGLLYLLGEKVGGGLWSGILLVVLFGGLPLLSQQMKGGGLDLLNVVLLAALLLLGINYAERRDDNTQEAFVYTALLLAFTRYESMVMLIPTAGVILWVWWRERRVLLSWPVMIAPLFFVLPLLQHRAFITNESQPGAVAAFGWHYVPGNLVHALGFFFDTTKYEPNSPIFGAIGLLACAFFILWILRVLRSLSTNPPGHVATAIIGVGLFAVFGLLMTYAGGQFDDPVAHHLSMPVYLLMAVAIVAAGASVILQGRIWQVGCGAAVLGLVSYSLPSMSLRAYGSSNGAVVEMEWRTDFLKRFTERDYLFLDNDCIFWITHKVPATPIVQAKEREEGLIYLLRNHTFSAMYVVQHFTVDPKTGETKLVPEDDLGPDFELEPFWEKRIQMLNVGRISRVTVIRKNGRVAAQAGGFVGAPGAPGAPTLSPQDAAKANKEYVDKWLKQLP